MILSSADILRILGGNQIIRLAAKVQLVESKPALSGREGLFIYIKRYPELAEFEATFTLWIESDGSEPDDIVVAELKKLLPKAQVTPGLMTEVKTTEFRSESTLEAPQAASTPQVDTSALEARFEALAEDIQDQMLLIHSGRDGQAGRDGRDGVDGRDGRDMVATDANLEDLQNVEQNIAKENGQVLTWKDGVWQNLFIPQVLSTISNRGTGGEGGGSFVAYARWRFDAATGSTPNIGFFQFNNADRTLATEVYLHSTEEGGEDVGPFLVELFPTGSRFYVQTASDSSEAAVYSVTATPVLSGDVVTISIEYIIDQGAAFGQGSSCSVSAFSAPGGAQALDDLTDVEASAPQGGQALVWNETTQLWEPSDVTNGSLIANGEWRFSNQTTGSPASGYIFLNNADPTLVTEIYIHETNNDGKDVGVFLQELIQPSSRLYIQDSRDSDNAVLYTVTAAPVDNGTFKTVLVTHEASQGTIANNKICGVSILGGGGGAGSVSVLDDLLDVDTTTTLPQVGDILEFNGSQWVPAANTGAGIEEAPLDGKFYVRQNGAWVDITVALQNTTTVDTNVDGADFTQQVTTAQNSIIYDAGDFTAGTSAATDNAFLDGEVFSGAFDDTVVDGGTATN